MIHFSKDDEILIEKLISSSSETSIESNGRRIIALIYIQNAGSYEILDLFKNFIQSASINAPLFVQKKLLVAALDESSVKLAQDLGVNNIIRIYNGSTSASSSFKFRLAYSLLSFNTSLLLMEADQVVLKNPFSGMIGDCDFEIASDYTRPTLLFQDIFALEKPIEKPVHEMADSVNIGLMLISPSKQSFFMLKVMMQTENSILSNSKVFGWDQKRFNFLLNLYIGTPIYLCYLNGSIVNGVWKSSMPCNRQGQVSHHVLLRLLPVEKYPLGPAFMWGRLHCVIPERDAVYLEQFSPSLPLCDTPNERKELVVVHAAGLLDISKIYFFRDRNLWYVEEKEKFENRRLISLDYSENHNSLAEQIMGLVQQIAWTIALHGDLILPLIDCKYIPNGIEVWRIGRQGKCSLDHVLKLSKLSQLFEQVYEEQTNRTWNDLQLRQKFYNNIHFVENSILQKNLFVSYVNRSNNKLTNYSGFSEKFITIEYQLTVPNKLTLLVTWHDNSHRSQQILSDDKSQLESFIQSIRYNHPEYHIQLIGLHYLTVKPTMHMLESFITYSFGSFENACEMILNSLFCNPWQIFFDKFPVYYHGTSWNIAASPDKCGISSIY